MATAQKINLGIAGAGGRGGSFKRSIDLMDSIRIHAVCDTDAEKLEEAAGRLGASQAFADYGEMLESPDLEAVLVGTPMPWHATQAIAALERGIHVLSEVPAAVSIEECRLIVQVCKSSSAIYMMAENYCYTRPNQIVKQMVREGVFGNPYYAMTNYQLQGVDGCYESARAPGDKNRVWLRSYDPDPTSWTDLEDLAERFTPPLWQEFGNLAEGVGHGGGDMLQMLDFVATIRGQTEPPIGVHEAMDMTLPGLVSQQSIRQNGKWLNVPNSRDW